MYKRPNFLTSWILGLAFVLTTSIALNDKGGVVFAMDQEVPKPSLDRQLADGSSDTATMVEGNTAFALDLYRQLSTSQGNLFFSPYSISNALAMTYAGARDQTAAEIAQVFHFQLEPNRLHPAFTELIAALEADHASTYQLAIANRLWGQKNYGFLPEFLNLLERYYSAPLQEVDFINATENARLTINAWVEQQTQNKIQDLLSQGILDSATRLVLTNAIYFQGNWLVPFDASQTRNQPFYLSSGETIEVPMMHQMEYWNYAPLDGLQVLELPYQGETLSMVILIPEQSDGLAALEQQLTPDHLQQWLVAAQEYPMMMDGGAVSVWLPKFKLTSTFELKDTLSAMGMPQAFTNADFSGMNGQRDLVISQVIHKAFVEVNEQGTEAAAATAVVTTRGGTQNCRIDRPFVFLIRDRDSGSILFLGRVVNPLD